MESFFRHDLRTNLIPTVYLTRTIIRFSLVLIGMLALCALPTFAQDWQPFTSPDNKFSVQTPSPPVLGGGVNGDTQFKTTSNNGVYIIEVHKLSFMEQCLTSDDALWKAALKGIGSEPTTYDDTSGKGWTGKAFTLVTDAKPKQFGIFARSSNRDTFYFLLAVGTPTDDANTFLKSFVVTEESGSDTWQLVIGLAMIVIGAVVTVGAIVLFVRAKKK